jgi:Arc/MetJ family transcription regulator
MRTTLALDDELLAKAQAFTGLREKSALVREALKALIERESARRLGRLGGSEPDFAVSPRRWPQRRRYFGLGGAHRPCSDIGQVVLVPSGCGRRIT